MIVQMPFCIIHNPQLSCHGHHFHCHWYGGITIIIIGDIIATIIITNIIITIIIIANVQDM